MGALDALKSILTFAQGHRTQVIMTLSAGVQVASVFGVLSQDQTEKIQSVLLPLAGATFAAKIQRASAIAKGVVGEPDPYVPPAAGAPAALPAQP